MAQRFPDAVLAILKRGGWPDRQTTTLYSIPYGFVLFPAADAVLSDFGGYRFGENGAGVTCAKCDVNIDPLLAEHIAEEVAGHSARLGIKLFPVGVARNGDFFILVDERSGVYLLFDDIIKVAETFDEALTKFLLGYE